MTDAVKCYGVQFSVDIVRQIDAGTKTQTRRVITHRPEHGGGTVSGLFTRAHIGAFTIDETPKRHRGAMFYAPNGADVFVRSPFGLAGDRWWVREPYWVDERDPSVIAYQATPELYTMRWATGKTELKRAEYPTTPRDRERPTRQQMHDEFTQNRFWHQRPAMLFPRWASRFTLEVTAVRAERLHSITRDGARAEGITEYGHHLQTEADRDLWRNRSSVENYAALWDVLNAKRGHPWASNPWVWVYTFTKVKT